MYRFDASYPHYLLEKGMAIHSSVLAWRIPWTKEPAKLQSVGLQRVAHDWAANTHTLIYSLSGFPSSSAIKNLPAMQEALETDPWVGKIPWRRKRQPIPVLLPLESHGWRSLVGYTVHRVAQSQTRQKWLSTHARILIITQSQMFSNFPGDFFWPMNCLKVCSLIYKYLCPILIDF